MSVPVVSAAMAFTCATVALSVTVAAKSAASVIPRDAISVAKSLVLPVIDATAEASKAGR